MDIEPPAGVSLHVFAAEAIAVADTVAVYTDELGPRRPTFRTEGLALDLAGRIALEWTAPTDSTAARAVKVVTFFLPRVGCERKMKRRRLS